VSRAMREKERGRAEFSRRTSMRSSSFKEKKGRHPAALTMKEGGDCRRGLKRRGKKGDYQPEGEGNANKPLRASRPQALREKRGTPEHYSPQKIVEEDHLCAGKKEGGSFQDDKGGAGGREKRLWVRLDLALSRGRGELLLRRRAWEGKVQRPSQEEKGRRGREVWSQRNSYDRSHYPPHFA